MAVTVTLSAEAEQKLRERAARQGRDVADYVRELIEKDVRDANGASGAKSDRQSLDDVLAPVRENFARSGMTEDDLARLVEEVREEVWQEQQARKVP